MDSLTFSTQAFPIQDQLHAWSNWFRSVFDVDPAPGKGPGFRADISLWKFGEVVMAQMSAPPVRLVRTAQHLRHSAVDHWVISYCRDGTTALATRKGEMEAPAGLPLVWSLGSVSESRRMSTKRLQLYLPRDSFSEIGLLLDNAEGSVLKAPQGQLLADFMLLLERNLPSLSRQDTCRLPLAIKAMVSACLAPSAESMEGASRQIELVLMDRVRRAVRRNLRSHSLTPDKLCREAAISRSRLYRVLEKEGGAANYIKRQRLAESFMLLCDVSNNLTITEVAEALCFVDVSSFSRAFRHEFSTSPRDVRAAAHACRPPPTCVAKTVKPSGFTFGDCLHC